MVSKLKKKSSFYLTQVGIFLFIQLTGLVIATIINSNQIDSRLDAVHRQTARTLNESARDLSLLSQLQILKSAIQFGTIEPIEETLNSVIHQNQNLIGYFVTDQNGQLKATNTFSAEGLYKGPMRLEFRKWLDEVDFEESLDSMHGEISTAVRKEAGQILLLKPLYIEDAYLGSVGAIIDLPSIIRSFSSLHKAPEIEKISFENSEQLRLSNCSVNSYLGVSRICLESSLSAFVNFGRDLYLSILLVTLFLGFLALWIARSIRERIAIRDLFFDFSAELLHNIRTPILGLETLAADQTKLPAKHKSLLKDSVVRIHELATKLLILYRSRGSYKEFSRHLASYENLEIRPEPVKDLVRKSVESMNRQISGAGSSCIQLNFQSKGHFLAKINASEFEALVRNILQNSIEATREIETPKIFVKLDAEAGLITIQDNGCGIPPSKIDSILKRGFSTKPSGSGIGLAHAKECVELWGGKLSIDSTEGTGTTVHIKLPVCENQQSLRVIPSAESPKKVLYDAVLIDDESLFRNSMKLRAQMLKKKVKCFSGFYEFIAQEESIDRHSPIYVDLDLKEDVSGDIRAQELKELGFHHVLLCTGNIDVHIGDTLKGIQVIDKTLPWESELNPKNNREVSRVTS